MNNNPVVSVIIFAYNHENYIEETVGSVLNQKCSFPIEIIVNDDCSTDNTLSIIERVKRESLLDFIIISNNINIGLNKCFVHAINRARGKYIALLGGDDCWIVEEKLEYQVNILKRNKEITFVHTAYKSFIEETNETIGNCNRNWDCRFNFDNKEDALTSLLCQNWTGYPLSSSSCFIKGPLIKGLSERSMLLKEKVNGEGTILHVSNVYYGGKYAFLPIETTLYRVRKKSLSHHDGIEDKFNYQLGYFNLRLKTAVLFNLNKKNIIKIKTNGFNDLFRFSIKNRTINLFNEMICNNHDFEDIPLFKVRVFLIRFTSLHKSYNKCFYINLKIKKLFRLYWIKKTQKVCLKSLNGTREKV